MAEWNHEHNPRFSTALYRSKGDHSTLSSTEVRAMLERGESLDGVVHRDAIAIIHTFLKEKK